MLKRNSGGGEGGGDSWLNTYADMVTLLLTFFAVLLSMSSVDQEKFNAFIESFSNLPPEVIEEIIAGKGDNPEDDPTATSPTEVEVTEAMDNLYQMLIEYVEQHGMQEQVSIERSEGIIFIRFDSAMFFHPDEYELLSTSEETLAFVGDGVCQYVNMIKLVAILGHTATVSEDYPVSEWMLSSQRAAVVGMYLDDTKGFDPTKIITIGYGGNFPVAENDTEEGRKQNRRVELAIISKNSTVSFDPYTGLADIYDSMGIYSPVAEKYQSMAEAEEDAKASPTPTPTPSPMITPEGATPVPEDVQVGVSPYD